MNLIFEKRSDDIRKNYLSLPENLPDRVTALAVDITKDYDNNYDKLKAIEAYLNTYTYTTNPVKTPKGKDFVDYFLFDQKEGYCTYFASTMAVMGRCIGIPTRYVEGINADYKNSNNDSVYAQPNSKAHAWVEAYIEGIGWIPFEPTAGYTSSRYSEWAPIEQSYAYSDYSKYYQPDISSYIDNHSQQNLPAKADNKRISSIIFVVILLFLFIFISFLLYYYISKLIYTQKLKKADINGRMYLIFAEMIYYLKQFGYKMKPQDTMLVFSEKIDNSIFFDGITFITAGKIFMKARYADKEISQKEYTQIIAFRDGLETKLSEKIGKLKVFLLKFLYYCK